MEGKMRLFVVEPHNSGGLVHYVYQLSNALAGEGIDVTLITATEYELADFPHNFKVVKMLQLWNSFDPESMQSQHLSTLERSWKKLRWTLRRGWRAFRLIVAWIRLSLFILRNRPDIVQFTKIEFPFEGFFIRALRERGLKLSQICHEFEYRESKSRFAFLFARNEDLYAQFSAIFFHAQENRDRFLSLFSTIPMERTHVIPHGNSGWLKLLKTDPALPGKLRQKYGLQSEERVILFFGLLSPSKGLDDLAEAFAILHQSCQIRLLIAGFPTKYFELEAFRAKLKALEIASDVTLDTRYIPLEEIGTLMEIATVVVYPYRSSTQSGALQVAYTFGRPVIATTVGGLPEAVEDGKNGFLVPPQDPKELAAKLSLLINNPQLADEMGKQAEFISETRFGWGSIASQIKKVYDDLLIADV